MKEEKEISEKTRDSDSSIITLQGIVIFKLMNAGSKSEGNFPFLKLTDTNVIPQSDISVILRLDRGISPTTIPIYLENSNPFENNTLKELEGKEVTAEGFMKDNIFHITKIAPCLTEHKES